MAGHGKDVGRTSGGGSLGHDQPENVSEQTPIRNQADERPTQSERAVEPPAGDDPVMPDDNPTLGTKI